MTLNLTFTAHDVANIRFAISPLGEVVASARVVKDPGAHPLLRPWADQVRRRLQQVDWRLLSDLVPVPTVTIAGFTCTPPSTSMPDLELELATMRGAADRVRSDLDEIPGPRTKRVQALYDDPDKGLERLAEEVENYWRAALLPYWPRIRSLLEGEILYRARLLADGGARRMLTDLDDAVTWQDETLRIRHRHATGTRSLRGLGLLLVPCVFVWPRIFSVTTPPYQPTVRYAPRGIATLWERRRMDPPEALAAVLGQTRARLLAELDQPASTRDLAQRVGLSPPGVNQHLTALHRAGLCSAHRTGRYVLYARTAVAEALLEGDPPAEA
ncbi:ArsR/SmtB family transcription factor [Nonomuraea jabiensis]|uniref:ArsR/SmtB family transcription factor n=1 Tax=Nonomuraea jabiensis TaxID=882448 RepID=UPI0036C3B6CB